jgi:hypothetical protein
VRQHPIAGKSDLLGSSLTMDLLCMSDNGKEVSLTFTELITGVKEAQDGLQQADLTLEGVRLIKGKVEDLIASSSSGEFFSALTADNRRQLHRILLHVLAKVDNRHDEFLRINFFFLETFDKLIERLRKLDDRLDRVSRAMNDSTTNHTSRSRFLGLQLTSIRGVSKSLCAIRKEALKAPLSATKKFHTFRVEITDPGYLNSRLTGDEIRDLLDPIIEPVASGALTAAIVDFVGVYKKVDVTLTKAQQTSTSVKETKRKRPLREFAVPFVGIREAGRQVVKTCLRR